ncbi:MAG: enoyl-CoA hydratase-related protein, partial [Planctomycetota bacterium]
MNTLPMINFQVDRSQPGVCRVILDVPQRPLNVLTESVMTELKQIVSELEQAQDVRVVTFESGKESGFLAGADVSVISQIATPAQAQSLLEAGQMLFQRIEWLPMTTIAVIHGPCMGGGLELSLACDYRIARD